MINLFAIFASEDGKRLLSRLYVAIVQFYGEKCPKDAEDAECANYADPHHHILSDALLVTNSKDSTMTPGYNCFSPEYFSILPTSGTGDLES